MILRMRVHLTPLATCLFAVGCAAPAAPRDDIHASIKKCGLEGQIRVEVEGERQLHIRYLNPNVDYTRFDCFLVEVRRLRLNLGIVGNEAPPTN
jgi:hypothetical protein